MAKACLSRLIVGLCFLFFFLWGWRVYDLLHEIPAFPDVLEVLWGIQWYHESLLEERGSPLSIHLIFHPLKWHTVTLGFNYFLFVVALPFYEIGGSAFAYNALAILALVLAFYGAFLFIKHFSPLFIAAGAALAFTFSGLSWFTLQRHLNFLWVLSLAPWMALSLEQYKLYKARKFIVLAGIFWGLMINFSFYGLFVGAMEFTILGNLLFHSKWIKHSIAIALIALLVSSPAIVTYGFGAKEGHAHYYGIEHNLHWGASLNSLFIPALAHPLPLFQNIASSIYKGPRDESGAANLGFTTFLLAIIGSILVFKLKKDKGLVFLALCGLILSLGLLLKWDGEPLRHCVFNPLIVVIWKIGHIVKPEVFRTPQPTPAFDGRIPLPGLVLIALIPFWEWSRAVSRYAVVGMLGMAALGGIALKNLPNFARYLLLILWLLEVLPCPIKGVRLPQELHPAYNWLAEQKLAPEEGIVDMAYPTLIMGPEILWAAWLHKKPTASGTGSYWPEHSFELWAHFTQKELSDPDIHLVFYQYRIRYLFLHMYGEREQKMWETISHNPVLCPIQCFEPQGKPFLWNYPICVAEVTLLEDPMNLIREEGWAGKEEWGIWSNGPISKARWLATSKQDYILQIEAFPFCVPAEHQKITVKVNSQEITTYNWENCEVWKSEVMIPAPIVKPGLNEIVLEYGYAISPAEITNGANPDPRKLAVGFKRLWIKEAK